MQAEEGGAGNDLLAPGGAGCGRDAAVPAVGLSFCSELQLVRGASF